MDIDEDNNEAVNNEVISSEEAAHLFEETMLDSATVVEFAPGEGQIPLSILRDENCEELAFPSIWFGHSRIRAENVKLSYTELIKSELRRSDRRAVRADHLFFAHKKIQLHQLCSNLNIAMRKRSQDQGITVSQALNNDFINSTIALDNAYRFTSKIVGTPGYWESQKKNVCAMVRQLGVFNLFVTLSAAEAHWPELLRILKKTVDKEDVTLSEASNLDFVNKARLIRSDPVTCALYFNHRFNELKKTWKVNGPFGGYEMHHFFHRIEFQHRGSPHVHMIIWLKGAPVYNPDDETCEERICSFVDLIATTETDDSDLEGIINYQYHKCTHTCKKTIRGKDSCRFGAPFPPMSRTMILKPLPDDYVMTEENCKLIRDTLTRMKTLLEEKANSFANFDEFLTELGVSIDDYLLALRAKLKSPKIFIKRAPKATRINQYNKKILLLFKSNTDIQAVLEAYGCIQYLVDYINKSNRGLSKLMRDCVESFQNGNMSIREKLQAVSNTLYNGSEVSAQEAAWCRLQLNMSASSDGFEFINTSSNKVSDILYSIKHY